MITRVSVVDPIDLQCFMNAGLINDLDQTMMILAAAMALATAIQGKKGRHDDQPDCPPENSHCRRPKRPIGNRSISDSETDALLSATEQPSGETAKLVITKPEQPFGKPHYKGTAAFKNPAAGSVFAHKATLNIQNRRTKISKSLSKQALAARVEPDDTHDLEPETIIVNTDEDSDWSDYQNPCEDDVSSEEPEPMSKKGRNSRSGGKRESTVPTRRAQDRLSPETDRTTGRLRNTSVLRPSMSLQQPRSRDRRNFRDDSHMNTPGPPDDFGDLLGASFYPYAVSDSESERNIPVPSPRRSLPVPNFKPRKERISWSKEETQRLVYLFQQYGRQWRLIQNKDLRHRNGALLQNRSNVDLKDRIRNYKTKCLR